MSLFRRTDILILQAQTILLILLCHFLWHLSLLHFSQFCQFILFFAYTERIILHSPYIPLPRLPGREFDSFRAVFSDHRTNLLIPSIYRSDGCKEFSGSDPCSNHPSLIQIKIKFLIIILPPREIGADRHLPDTTMRQQYLFQFGSPAIKFIIIISVHFHPE